MEKNVLGLIIRSDLAMCFTRNLSCSIVDLRSITVNKKKSASMKAQKLWLLRVICRTTREICGEHKKRDEVSDLISNVHNTTNCFEWSNENCIVNLTLTFSFSHVNGFCGMEFAKKFGDLLEKYWINLKLKFNKSIIMFIFLSLQISIAVL